MSKGQGYLDVMSMPIGRRRRFCEELAHIDKVRAKRAEKKK